MNIYIHTLSGQPAVFDGSQVCYAPQFGVNKPAISLRQIRREQKESIKFRLRVFGEIEDAKIYGYRRYKV